ncbi:hypothetical protein [Micromonospora sp. NPDC007230]|uniref:hypothetical protein n=1 Tax=Micromonospora sp. NPDC007230 TaxID=3364237 RepID=UPI0036BCD509
MRHLRDLAVRLALGEAVGDELPMAAATALCEGADSPALRELAGLSKGESREAVDLFRVAMEELGEPVPDGRRARLHRMREAAATVLDGAGDPEELAHEIHWQACYSGSPELRRVGDRFLELYAGWGVTHADAEASEAAMRAAAESFLQAHPA